MKRSITISCAKSNLQLIRNFIVDELRKLAISELEVHSMVLAVDEVCANLIIHSNNCSPEHSIKVVLEPGVDRISFDIIDNGTGFDIRNYPEPDLKEIIKTKKKGGVGLLLVKRIMDEIDFVRNENQSIVRLTKKLHPSG